MEASQNRSNVESANNENDVEGAAHQKQRVRQNDLRGAPPVVMAENETKLKEKERRWSWRVWLKREFLGRNYYFNS